MRTRTAPLHGPASPHERDIRALAQALVPLAKVCMKSGMGAGELQIAVKIACISVAAESAKLGVREIRNVLVIKCARLIRGTFT